MLGYLPYNQTVKLVIKTKELDKWGQPVISESTEIYSCYIRETTLLEEKYSSKEIVDSLVFGIEGNVTIKSGDIVESEGNKYVVAKSRKIRDLSGEVITTLVYV